MNKKNSPSQIATILVPPPPPPPAGSHEILLTVLEADFKDIFEAEPTGCDGRGTPFKMELATLSPGLKDYEVLDDRTGKKYIRVYNSKATIRFRIQRRVGEKGSIFPVGIGFVQLSPTPANPQERLGLNCFDPVKRDPGDRVLTVGCNFNELGEAYDFYLFIQDGRYGRIGIIDPRIVHDSTKDD